MTLLPWTVHLQHAAAAFGWGGHQAAELRLLASAAPRGRQRNPSAGYLSPVP